MGESQKPSFLSRLLGGNYNNGYYNNDEEDDEDDFQSNEEDDEGYQDNESDSEDEESDDDDNNKKDDDDEESDDDKKSDDDDEESENNDDKESDDDDKESEDKTGDKKIVMQVIKEAVKLKCPPPYPIDGMKCPKCRANYMFSEPIIPAMVRKTAVGLVGFVRDQRYICLNPKCRANYIKTRTRFKYKCGQLVMTHPFSSVTSENPFRIKV